MQTLIEKASEESVARAAGILRGGGLVAFPTETVYGLGANGLSGQAVEGIYAAKGRPADNPLILHIARKPDADALAEVDAAARALMDAFWPGPLTLVLPRKACVPDAVTAGLSTVAVRMPAHEVARRLILAAGLPLAAPSANASGRPSPTLAEHVADDLSGKIDMILDGGPVSWGVESTVAQVTDGGVFVLRPGAVTPEQLRQVVPNVRLDTPTEAAPRAPGMKYTHYSPKAGVILVKGTPRRVAEYINAEASRSETPLGILASAQTLEHIPGGGKRIILSLGDRDRPEEAAGNLFACLREFDRRGAARIYAEAVDERGLGLAVMNRLGKAACSVVEV